MLVVEQHDRPGGYAHAFRRRGYRFDGAVHLTSGCEASAWIEGSVLHDTLTALGVRDRCDFVRVDPLYRAIYPGLVIDARARPETFVESHAEHFGDASSLADLLRAGSELRREALGEPETGSPGFPQMRRFRRSTVASASSEFTSDPRLRAVYATLWPYLGLPPSELSFVYWAAMLASYLEDGAFYCRGTFQQLATALVDGIEGHGGEVRFRSRVGQILVDDETARGVALSSGRIIDAKVVISNADPFQTTALLPEGSLPAGYRKKLDGLEPSISAFVAYLATELPLEGWPHETFCYAHYDHDENWRETLAGTPSWFSATVPTHIDPDLAPPGQHLMTLTTLAPYRSREFWQKQKPNFLEALLKRAETVFPGLRGSLRYAEAGTPHTMQRYTENRAGALYGFALSPRQVGSGRPDFRTPLAGLFLAGHWSRPGGGVYGAALSGKRCADEILGSIDPENRLR